MDLVDARKNRLRRALDAKLRPALMQVRMGQGIPADKVLRDLTARMRLRAKKQMMPKPYVRRTSLPRGYLFNFKDERGIGVPRSLRLV